MKDKALLPLFKQYRKQADPEILEQLVEAYLYIPKTIVSRFNGQGLEEEDIFQVASIALIKAIERFDPDMGFKFITFATPTIIGDVKNYIRDKGGLIRTGRKMRSLLYNIQIQREAFEQEHFREPTLDELAQLMMVDRSELIQAIVSQNETNVASLDSPISEEESDSLYSIIGNTDPNYKHVDDESFMLWVKNHTNEQEFSLLQLRFVDELSQRDVAKRLNVSQMQVSRLEKRIFQRLKVLVPQI